MTVTICLDPIVADLYVRVAEAAGLQVEVILADVLFQVAGRLSLEGLQIKGREIPPS